MAKARKPTKVLKLNLYADNPQHAEILDWLNDLPKDARGGIKHLHTRLLHALRLEILWDRRNVSGSKKKQRTTQKSSQPKKNDSAEAGVTSEFEEFCRKVEFQ